MQNWEVWQFVLLIVFVFLIGLALGFFGGRALIKHEMKKNPPITEAQIRAMFMSMGRKPSEAQIKAVMNSMKKNM
jgi:uncharacterized protein YneF (UPF0154 family)